MIYYTPYPDVTSRYSLNEPEKVCFVKTGEDVMDLLSGCGPGTAASIIPDGTISCFR